MLKFYSDSDYQNYAENIISKNKIKNIDGKVTCVEKGVIISTGRHSRGVYTKNGFYINKTDAHNNTWHWPFELFSNVPYMDCEVLYLGSINKGFGHFLWQYTNRLWAVKEYKNKNIKYAFLDRKSCKGIVSEYVYTYMQLLGVNKEDIIIINKPVRFKKVYVPEVSNERFFVSDLWGKWSDTTSANIKIDKTFDKIYLTRTALGERKTFGEDVVEKIFAKNGFKVFSPEKLPLTEQIALVANCKVLAGCAGTALHLALFMKSGGTVIQIKRNSKYADNIFAQYQINTTKNLDTIIIAGSIEKVQTQHYTHVPQIIGVTQYMKQFFDENNISYTDKDIVLPDSVWQDYETALGNMTNEKYFIHKLKKKFIHYTSCFLPGRMMRKNYRHFMQRKLGV